MVDTQRHVEYLFWMQSRGLSRIQIPESIGPLFWSRASVGNSSDCWIWNGTRRNHKYGQIGFGKKYWMAHVVSYVLMIGDVPAGMCVCHKCDNPICVNPNHFFLGTKGDNNADRERKGRGANRKGELNGRAILTTDQVHQIRERGKHTAYDELAESFGVKTVTIAKIRQRKLWKHVV